MMWLWLLQAIGSLIRRALSAGNRSQAAIQSQDVQIPQQDNSNSYTPNAATIAAGSTNSQEVKPMTSANNPRTPEEFIDILAPLATDYCSRYGLLASVCIAQAAIETGWGKRAIGNNWFGRKAVSGDACEVKTTREFINGEWVTIEDRFKSYGTLTEAVEDYCVLLTLEPVYVYALTGYESREDYIKRLAGIYATDPSYAELIKTIIREWELEQFDEEVGV